MRIRGRLTAVALVVVNAQATFAQRLMGAVRSAADSSPVVGAVIGISPGTFVRTDTAGVFRFSSVKTGRYEMQVRRLGFEPFARFVEVKVGEDNSYEIRMTPLPVRLVDVTVRGKRRQVPYRFEEVYRRGASGFGHLITLEDIEERRPFLVRDMLNGIPAVDVRDDGIMFRRCGGANRYSAMVDPPKVQVYVDGKRMIKFQGGESPLNVDAALQLVNVTNVQAIEVYQGVADIPAEFSVDACAVIAVWTKRY